MAYDKIETFGQLRDDLRCAIIASTVASANSKKSWKPKDFMPFLEDEKPEYDWQETKKAFMMLAKGK
tara:strand:+ start:201 stop:401 length:201 start_codon:yes stop_codon:yes gene_type:complete